MNADKKKCASIDCNFQTSTEFCKNHVLKCTFPNCNVRCRKERCPKHTPKRLEYLREKTARHRRQDKEKRLALGIVPKRGRPRKNTISVQTPQPMPLCTTHILEAF